MPANVTLSQLAGNRTVNELIQSMEMEKALEGRSIRIALGVVSALLAVFVIYRIWLDNSRSSIMSYKHRFRYKSSNLNKIMWNSPDLENYLSSMVFIQLKFFH